MHQMNEAGQSQMELRMLSLLLIKKMIYSEILLFNQLAKGGGMNSFSSSGHGRRGWASIWRTNIRLFLKLNKCLIGSNVSFTRSSHPLVMEASPRLGKDHWEGRLPSSCEWENRPDARWPKTGPVWEEADTLSQTAPHLAWSFSSLPWLSWELQMILSSAVSSDTWYESVFVPVGWINLALYD